MGVRGRSPKKFKKISPYFWVARGEEQISDPLGNRNLFFAPDTSELMYAGNTGV